MPDRTLIVPDIHEQMAKLRSIEERFFPEASRVVMLGDFFDTFTPEDDGLSAAKWVKEHIDDPKVTFLLGNHDASYAFGGAWRCSGYSPYTHKNFRDTLSPTDIRKFYIFTHVGPFLLSHAGFHPRTVHLADLDTCRLAMELALDGDMSPIFQVGFCRGGGVPRGGPLWLDWNQEFEPMKQAQIVGHTHKTRSVRSKTYNGGENPDVGSNSISYCLDSGLNHVMWVDDETHEVEIVALDGAEIRPMEQKP